MRLAIEHVTEYQYGSPASYSIQSLRLTPRNHDGQYASVWRVETESDCHMRQEQDAFGNIQHIFSLEGPIDAITIRAIGEVETDDTSGVIGGTLEKLPLELFLRETNLTASSSDMRDFARESVRGLKTDSIDALHALNTAVHERLTFDTGKTVTETTAAAAFNKGAGVCQDFSHILISCARILDIPARYVGGYMYRVDGVNEQEAGHGWVELHIPDLGWTGFDPANGICTTAAHIRVAIGLDYLGASPVRGIHYGGSGENLAVSVRLERLDG